MWQLFTLAASVFNAAETTTDKVIMVADRKLDTVVTSFYRNLMFFALSLAVGLTGLVGTLHFRFHWLFVIFAVLGIIDSIFYTIFLKKIEMSGIAAIKYAAPFLFLLTDVFIVKAPLAPHQIAGITLLICGSLIFMIDPHKRRIKSQYTKYIIAMLVFNIIYTGGSYYLFQYYSAQQNLNEISYLVSVWSWVALGLLIVVVSGNKWKLLLRTAASNNYLGKITLSKSFDVGSSLLWYHALSLATVSQVNSFNAFEPLILLFVLLGAQQLFKFKVDEDFATTSLLQKVIATFVLIAGAWLAS